MVSSAVLIVGGGLAVATSVFAILRKRQKKAHDAPPTDGKRTLKRSGTSFVIGKPIGAPTPDGQRTLKHAGTSAVIGKPIEATIQTNAERSISVIIMLNMQEDFIGALPAHAVPTSFVHLERADSERVRSGVLKLVKWHRALPKDSDLFILHSMQSHDHAEVPTLKKYGGVHCVVDTDGWRAVSLAHLSAGAAALGRGPREKELRHDGMLSPLPGSPSPVAAVEALMADARIIDPSRVHVAVVGVWTELVLHTLFQFYQAGFPSSSMATCSELIGTCGDRHGCLNHLRGFFKTEVFSSVGELCGWLLPECGRPKLGANVLVDGSMGCGTVRVTKGDALSDDDLRIVQHLFRGVGDVSLRQFSAGFTDANVYLGTALSSEGVELAPSVVKIGPAGMLMDEAQKLADVATVLGNACPTLHATAEHLERAGMRIGYASLAGTARSLADVLRGVTTAAAARSALQVTKAAMEYVLSESWGRYYRAGVTHEQDLYVVCGFVAPTAATMGLLSPGPDGFPYSWVLSLAEDLEWIDEPLPAALATAEKELAVSSSAGWLQFSLPGEPLAAFPPVSALLADLRAGKYDPLPRAEVRWATVHGDLHGDNLMVDANNNAFLIDLDSWRPGPILSDVAHIEGFVLFDYLVLTSEAEFNEAMRLVPLLAGSYLLPTSTTPAALGLSSANVISAFETVRALRALAVEHLLTASSTSDVSTCCPLQAALPLLARAIFWIHAPQQHDKAQPVLNRRFALAYACALARVCVPPKAGGN